MKLVNERALKHHQLILWNHGNYGTNIHEPNMSEWIDSVADLEGAQQAHAPP